MPPELKMQLDMLLLREPHKVRIPRTCRICGQHYNPRTMSRDPRGWAWVMEDAQPDVFFAFCPVCHQEPPLEIYENPWFHELCRKEVLRLVQRSELSGGESNESFIKKLQMRRAGKNNEVAETALPHFFPDKKKRHRTSLTQSVRTAVWGNSITTDDLPVLGVLEARAKQTITSPKQDILHSAETTEAEGWNARDEIAIAATTQLPIFEVLRADLLYALTTGNQLLWNRTVMQIRLMDYHYNIVSHDGKVDVEFFV